MMYDLQGRQYEVTSEFLISLVKAQSGVEMAQYMFPVCLANAVCTPQLRDDL